MGDDPADLCRGSAAPYFASAWAMACLTCQQQKSFFPLRCPCICTLALLQREGAACKGRDSFAIEH